MPRLDIDCPLCGSRHAERAALVWAKGLSRSRSSTLGAGGLLALPFQVILGGASPFSLAMMPILLPALLLKSFFGFGLFAARSWGESQTVLSAEARPPFRFPIWKAVLMAPFAALTLTAVCLLVAMALSAAYGLPKSLLEAAAPLILIACAALCAAVVALGAAYNRRVWPGREAVWQRSFLCKRCGANFVVPDYDPVGENAVRSDRAGRGGLLPLAGAPETRAQARAKAESDERLLRKKRTGVTH